ncbi:MAG: hypothetical protein JWM58_3896 [Rhizobium sp.]|nr:hypothetical protein [Rhizobium sp.]
MIKFSSIQGILARVTILSAVCLSVSGAFAEDKAVDNQKPAAKTAREEIKAFCANIADAARDQRYQMQKEELTKLQAQVNDRIVVLEQRKGEYQDWLNRRNAFMKQAQAGLTSIYAKMAPDAAAAQMNLVDPNLAAAIITKLKPGQASLILTEMDPKSAATVTAIMSAIEQRDAARNPT